jgi:hypothetical protein
MIGPLRELHYLAIRFKGDADDRRLHAQTTLDTALYNTGYAHGLIEAAKLTADAIRRVTHFGTCQCTTGGDTNDESRT